MIATANGHDVHALLACLEGVKQSGDKWQAQCPAHDDSVASLSIKKGDNGGIVLKCHANCDTRDVVRAIGWEMKDLAPPDAQNGNGKHADTVYDYRDGHGDLVFQVVRGPNKKFYQRNAAGENKVTGCAVVPYRLSEILRADPAEVVLIVEGEKDVDRLRSLGFVATCNAGGAGSWKIAHSNYLQGRSVCIIPDNDKAGRDHADKVEASLAGITKTVVRLDLDGLPDKGDVSDWLNIKGNTTDKLRNLITVASLGAIAKGDFPRLNLAALTEQYPRLNPPVIHGLLREGETANFIANPKVGKSWAMYGLAINVATGTEWFGIFQTAQSRVLIVDNELHPQTLAHRIPQVGYAMALAEEEYRELIDLWCLRGNLRSLPELLTMFRQHIKRGDYKLIILDAKYRFATAGASENDNAAETQSYNTLDQIAAETGAAVVAVHHASKGAQSDKRVTDVGAGAGAQSRAADCHMVLREHEDNGVAVLDAAVRSFPPVEPLALRWSFPVWRPDDFADAGKLKGKLTASEQRQGNRDKEGIDAIVKALRTGDATARDIRRQTGISKDRCDRLLDKLEADNQITSTPTEVRGNKSRLYHVVDD